MANNVRKVMEDLDSSQAKIDKARRKLKLTCDHQVGPREPALDSYEHKGDSNKKVFKCRKCGALINMHAPSESKIDEAYETLETASHYMRLMQDPTSDKGKDTCEWLGGVMMDVTKMTKAYKQMKTEQAKRVKKQQSNRGSHSSARFEN